MTKTINWRQFWIDMFGILIGITIAFQLQSWKERRGDAKLKMQYLKGLSTDLEADINELNLLVDTTTVAVNACSNLTKNLMQKNYSDKALFGQVMSFFVVSEFLPQTTSYQSLVNSGDLALFKDFELRQNITAVYSTLYDEIDFYDNTHTGLFSTQIYPYINKRLQFGNQNPVEDISFLQSNEFINFAFANRYALANQLEAYKKALAAAEALKEQVDKKLKN